MVCDPGLLYSNTYMHGQFKEDSIMNPKSTAELTNGGK